MNELITVKAELELFKGNNMLQRPIVSKYRPLFYFPGAVTKVSGSIELINADSLYPGTNSVLKITFVNGIISENYFKKGQVFTISEGLPYDLGKGEILELLKENDSFIET